MTDNPLIEHAAEPWSEGVEPLARIYGQPMQQLPLDLYIPPDAMAVMLDAFEGPLDLLLYLIRKANVNVLDIPMAPLTVQYLTYVEAMRSHNLELAAHRLDDMPQAERDFDWVEVWVEKSMLQRLPEVRAEDLKAAWGAILHQAKLHTHHLIQREELSVREHMGLILRQLRSSGGFVEFVNMFDPTLGAQVLVVHFLAMLELAREHLLEMTQAEAFSPIYVRLANGRSETQANAPP
jgi:segregation and condensation protein A